MFVMLSIHRSMDNVVGHVLYSQTAMSVSRHNEVTQGCARRTEGNFISMLIFRRHSVSKSLQSVLATHYLILYTAKLSIIIALSRKKKHLMQIVEDIDTHAIIQMHRILAFVLVIRRKSLGMKIRALELSFKRRLAEVLRRRARGTFIISAGSRRMT